MMSYIVGSEMMPFHHQSEPSQSSSNAGIILLTPNEVDTDSDEGEIAPYMGKVLSRPVTLKQLHATIKQTGYLENEFRKLPPNHVDPSEIPSGAEIKNRFSNVLPSLRTRVSLGAQQGIRQNQFYIGKTFTISTEA